ncbi:LysM peptidoglycan-binding domain-containing protein [Rothia nasimurium]|uniref:LysM peptidoglycan-binding domain-containing protein n=1 Tax=Rothia nasimurium TaxID=85336 RepID=UPI001F3032F1|nr:LysM peptidoglycan-binding domain-containing protein [Rothia nasimurium]
MSAIASSAAQPFGGRIRLTRRGRFVFRGLPVLTLLALMVIGALTMLMPTPATSSNLDISSAGSQTVTVYHGDNLWTIAEDIAPGLDSRDVINQIMEINDLTTAKLVPGQKLVVPTYTK